MAAEGGEALLDALLVADVGVDGAEDGHLGAGSAGTSRPDCAIRVSSPTVLSATVLPPVFGPVMSRTRKSSPRRTSVGTTLPVSRGWRAATRLTRPVAVERRRGGAQLGAVARLGQTQVDGAERVDGLEDRAGLLSDQGRELVQDALDLVALVELELVPLVVQLGHAERLDKQGRAAGRLVVDDALDLPLELGFDGDHVAPVARRDQGILHGVAVLL